LPRTAGAAEASWRLPDAQEMPALQEAAFLRKQCMPDKEMWIHWHDDYAEMQVLRR
jgi:hypothetical protein